MAGALYPGALQPSPADSLAYALLPFIRDSFHLDYARSGLVLSVFSITYGLSQLPSGWLADRLGASVLMTIGVCGVATSGILIGFTPSYALLLACLGLMGFVGGGYHPSAPPLVSATVPPQDRGRALGIHAIGGSASYFLAPVLYLMNRVHADWWIYSLLVAIGVIIAFTQTSSESHIVGGVARERCSSVLGVYYFINMAGAGVITPALGALIDQRGFSPSFSLAGVAVVAGVLAYGLWLWWERRWKRQGLSL